MTSPSSTTERSNPEAVDSEGPVEIATLEEVLAATEKRVRLPGLSEAVGQPRGFLIRRIGFTEYLSFLPAPPPGSHEWPEDRQAWSARERAWLETLSPEVRDARRAALREVVYKVVAAAVLDPALTVDQARRLGEDATVLMTEILAFSKILLPRPGAAQGPADPEPPAADAA